MSLFQLSNKCILIMVFKVNGGDSVASKFDLRLGQANDPFSLNMPQLTHPDPEGKKVEHHCIVHK